MTILRRVLLIIIALELLGTGLLAMRAAGRIPAPLPDFTRLEAETAADLRALHAGLNESDPTSWQQLAEAYMGFGYLPESELCFRRAAVLDPHSGLILYGWASCLERLGLLAEADARYEQAAALLPDPYPQSCVYRIGRNALRSENWEAANAALTRAGMMPAALSLRARNSLRTGHLSEALSLLHELQQHMPAAIQTVQLEADCAQAQGQLARAASARERLERVQDRIDLNDQHLALAGVETQFGFLRRINHCSQLNDPGQTCECLLATIAGHPQEYVYLPRVADLLIKAGDPERAADLLQRAIQQGNLSPAVEEQLGDAARQLGRQESAHTHWLQAVALGPSVTAHGKLSESFRARGDAAAAQEHAALQREVDGVAAYRKDVLGPAIAALQEAVELNPARPRAWYYLGQAYRATGDIAKARDAYQTCLQADPDHGRARLALDQLSAASTD